MLIWGIAFSILFISLSTFILHCFHINVSASSFNAIIWHKYNAYTSACVLTLYSMRMRINMCIQSVRAHAYEISLQFYRHMYIYCQVCEKPPPQLEKIRRNGTWPGKIVWNQLPASQTAGPHQSCTPPWVDSSAGSQHALPHALAPIAQMVGPRPRWSSPLRPRRPLRPAWHGRGHRTSGHRTSGPEPHLLWKAPGSLVGCAQNGSEMQFWRKWWLTIKFRGVRRTLCSDQPW